MGEGHTRWTSSHTDLRSEPALPVWPLFYTLQTYQIPRRSGAQPTFSFSFFFLGFAYVGVLTTLNSPNLSNSLGTVNKSFQT